MKIQYLTASCVGNTLEWFDFGLFIYLATQIGAQFFPVADPQMAALAAFAVFAAGSICRPLGAVFFGYVGDRFGRAVALRASILTITLTMLLVGLLPTYQQLGMLATGLFIFVRLLQGLSVGGEYTSAAVYIAELAPTQYRGFFTAFVASSANAGFLLATLVVLLLKASVPLPALQAWGWRLPFLFSGLLGLAILYYRLRLIETPAYSELRRQQRLTKIPLLAAFRSDPGNMLKIFGMTAMGSSCYFVFFGYMPTYLAEYADYPPQLFFTLQGILLLLMIILIPVAGICGDRFGRKNMLIIAGLALFLLVLPGFYLLQSKTILAIVVSLMIAALLSALEQGNTLATAIEHCPAEIRCTTVSFAYNLGNALLGGSSPLIAALLAQGINHFAPAYYLMGMAIISLVAITSLRNMRQVTSATNI